MQQQRYHELIARRGICIVYGGFSPYFCCCRWVLWPRVRQRTSANKKCKRCALESKSSKSSLDNSKKRPVAASQPRQRPAIHCKLRLHRVPMRPSLRVQLCRWITLRSEEHTSELQSLAYLVCRLLLEKKKKECMTVMCRVGEQCSAISGGC